MPIRSGPIDGCLYGNEVCKALPGYTGWVVLEAEQDPEGASPLACAKHCVAHPRAAIEEAGLR